MNIIHQIMKLISGMIYLIIGIFLFKIAHLFLISTFHSSLLGLFIMLPFIIAFYMAVTMIFIIGLKNIMDIIVQISHFKLFFYIEGKIYKIYNIIQKLPKYLSKIYIVAFLFYWFIIIIISAISTIKEQNYPFLLFLLPFLLTGVWMIKKLLSKK